MTQNEMLRDLPVYELTPQQIWELQCDAYYINHWIKDIDRLVGYHKGAWITVTPEEDETDPAHKIA